MRTIELVNGKGVAIVDDEDYDRLAQHRWFLNDGYAYTRCSRRMTGMHRLVVGESSSVVDHINGNRLDNRRENLRQCSRSQNRRGWRSPKKGTSSRYRGVTWHRRDGVWLAKTAIDGRTVHLGRFKSELEAALAYDTFVLTHFGDFASPNILHRLGSAVTVRVRAT